MKPSLVKSFFIGMIPCATFVLGLYYSDIRNLDITGSRYCNIQPDDTFCDERLSSYDGYDIYRLRNGLLTVMKTKKLTKYYEGINDRCSIAQDYADMLLALERSKLVERNEILDIMKKAKTDGTIYNGYNLLAMSVHMIQLFKDKKFITQKEGQELIDRAKGQK